MTRMAPAGAVRGEGTRDRDDVNTGPNQHGMTSTRGNEAPPRLALAFALEGHLFLWVVQRLAPSFREDCTYDVSQSIETRDESVNVSSQVQTAFARGGVLFPV